MKLSVEAVDFRYRRRLALSQITWQVEPGITGLLGPNGAGKTTLLNVLVGLSKPAAGRVTLPVFDGSTAPIGYVPQRFSLAGEMRVGDTISYAAWVNGVSRSDCGDAGARALARVGLADRTHARVRSLSGGQRRRLAIAAGLAHDPHVLILDEPTVGLDPGQRLRLRQVIHELGSSRLVILSTHLMEDIRHLAERVAVLAQGRMVFDGNVDELEARLPDTRGALGDLGTPFEHAYDQLMKDLDSGE